jgi:hypothetical protein
VRYALAVFGGFLLALMIAAAAGVYLSAPPSAVPGLLQPPDSCSVSPSLC